MEIFSIVRFLLFKTYERRSQMNKMLNCLANKAICAAFVVLGVASAGARSVVTTNALYDAVNTDVSVGYQVSGLEGDEIAVVFTNDACEVINWKVPARLNDVQFLVVGGGGGGLTAADIAAQGLPLPQRDFLPLSPEEKLVCLADKFFSKSGDMEEKKFSAVQRSMAKFGTESSERFNQMWEFFTFRPV